MNKSIKITLSKIALGISFNFNDFADEMLADGYESPELLMLSLPSESNELTLRSALLELNVSIPDKIKAREVLVRHYLENIVNNHGNINGLKEFMDVMDKLYDKIGDKYVCDDKVDEMVKYYWYLEEYSSSELTISKDEIENRIKALAGKLLYKG
jgi:hypothetical protein